MTLNTNHSNEDVFIRLETNPAIPDFDPSEYGFPDEAELKVATQYGVDNFSVIQEDPVNWLIFDPGNEYKSYPKWVEVAQTISERYDAGSLLFIDPGAGLPLYHSHGTDSVLHETGGPRNLGYTEVGETTWIRLNHQVGYQTVNTIPTGRLITPANEVWKEGSIELTIKPDKSNCTIVSGTIFPDIKTPNSVLPWAHGRQIHAKNVGLGIKEDSGQPYDYQELTVAAEFNTKGFEELEASYVEDYSVYVEPSQGGGIPYIIPNPQDGLYNSNLDHTLRTFKVDLVNGVIKVSYQIHYGDNKKLIEFSGNTNIVDGQWHNIIINRPTEFTIKQSEERYGDNGCIEIWVDGKLDARSYEINSNDPLPTPNILFNTFLNSGILNYVDVINPSIGLAVEWINNWQNDEIEKTNYVGGIRDFIFRQSTALSPHNIYLNYIYSIVNDANARTCKVRKATATATMVNPTVSVNKKNVIKLYWNTLLDNKEKCLDGLELDETFNVYSYSTTKKNIVSPTQTFNLDLNDETKTRFFAKDVKTAIGKHVFLLKPGIQLESAYFEDDFGNVTVQQIDYTNERSVIQQYYAKDPAFVNNLQYGGVFLNEGDRVLLFNQPRSSDNGIWIFTGPNSRMKRPEDMKISEYYNAHVYVSDGKYAGTTFIQTNKITSIKTSPQNWIKVDKDISLSTIDMYPIHTSPWLTEVGEKRFINVNTDIDVDYDVIVFMNYPNESKDIYTSLESETDTVARERYQDFIENLKTAVSNGKSLYVSSPLLAVDLGITSDYHLIPQMLNESGDAQSAAISPFESGEPAEYYFDTHRNMKYQLIQELPGLTDKETYLMTDFVTYSPDRTDSDYHIKYSYRQFGIQEGDEFYIPGVTTVPETLNGQLPGYLFNQKGTSDLVGFHVSHILLGTPITSFSNTVYDGDDAISNPYDDYINTIAVEYGSGKMFVNCVENGYAFSRSDYNTALKQNVTAGQNSETVLTAAWQYSTKRLNKKNLYDFSEISNLIGQTTPTTGGGGAAVQAQSHCSNGVIRKKTNLGNLQYQSDLYTDATEEIFGTTQIPVLSMTWLGLQWLAE